MKENKMGTMPVGKLLITMSLPIIASMFVQAFYNVVDTYFISSVSQLGVTALGYAFPIQNIMIGLAVGIGVGMNALVSKALGQKNRKKDHLNSKGVRKCFSKCLRAYTICSSRCIKVNRLTI